MESPFPGMDPYLEQHWGDVHHKPDHLCRGDAQRAGCRPICGREHRNALLFNSPPTITPSTQMSAWSNTSAKGSGGVAVATTEIIAAEPLEVSLLEPETQGFLEIIESHPNAASSR